MLVICYAEFYVDLGCNEFVRSLSVTQSMVDRYLDSINYKPPMSSSNAQAITRRLSG